MPETPDEFYARVAAYAAAQPDGRLPVTAEFTDSDIYPFEGDSLRAKAFEPPVVPEPARAGEPGGPPCHRCEIGDQGAFWGNERWLLVPAGAEFAIPFAALLMPREHLDYGELDAAMAGEMGVLMVAIEHAVKSLGDIGRVHASIIGDGGAHLHVWFFGRPLGQLQLRGSCLIDWMDLLPALPADQVSADQAAVADALVASYGGAVLPVR
jgi:hypothetical protein